MAYSENHASGREIRAKVKKLAPSYVVITKKETTPCCSVVDKITGRELWRVPKNHDLEVLLSNPKFDITKSHRLGFKFSPDPGLKNRLELAYAQLARWNSDKERARNPQALIYAKCWEIEIQELKGEI
jgi:hypothetical protein